MGKIHKYSILTLYIVIIITIISIVSLSCNNSKNTNDILTINTSHYDKISYLDEDSLETLFNKGITAKIIEDSVYFIYNTISDNINDSIVINWGPITSKTNVIDNPRVVKDKNTIKIDFNLSLQNKFNKNIDKIEFYPSWIAYSGSEGFLDVNKLPETIIYIMNNNRNINLPISIIANINEIESKPLFVSIKTLVFYNDKAFEEIITLKVKNTWSN